MSLSILIALVIVSVAYGVETVRYQRRAAHPHDIYILTSVLSEANIAVIQCFIQAHNNNAPLSWDEQREHCCNAIVTSSVHVVERKRIPKQCRDESVPIPDLKALTTLSQRQPQLIFIEDHVVDEIPDLTNSVWSYFVWDDIILLGFWLAGHDATQKTAFLRPLQDSSHAFFQARIDSKLPLTGGMHRSMEHSVQLDLTMMTTRADSVHISLWILLVLPSDVFVLPNDAFENYPQGMALTLHTVPGRVLSEEEPVFASPSHAVYIHMEGNLRNTEVDNKPRIEFATKIHFRYPQPSSDPSNTYQIVSILAPEVVAGEITSTSKDGTNTTFLLQPPGHAKATASPDHPIVLYALVATPQQSDLRVVLATTVLVSLLGVAVIWKETICTAEG